MEHYTKHFNHSLIKLSNIPSKQGKRMRFQQEVGVVRVPSGVCLDLQAHKYHYYLVLKDFREQVPLIFFQSHTHVNLTQNRVLVFQVDKWIATMIKFSIVIGSFWKLEIKGFGMGLGLVNAITIQILLRGFPENTFPWSLHIECSQICIWHCCCMGEYF